jgi:dolichol-phosphate mannosyltransferase
MSYTVILPTLNENGHIIKLIQAIEQIFINNKLQYEILIIDDNSTDGTIDSVKKLLQQNYNVKLFIREGQKKNLAKSINLGIENSKFAKIIWMDADFQHPPEYIQKIIDNYEKTDVIVFSRFLKESIRYFEIEKNKKELNEDQSIFFNKLCRLVFYKDLTDYTSGYICLKKKIFDGYKLEGFYGDYFLSLLVHCKKKKLSILELPFKERARETGSSKTAIKINIKYLYLCINYFLTLLKNIPVKYIK